MSLKLKFSKCGLCPNNCVLEMGQIGKCRVRQNINGKIKCLVYGKVATVNIDPIEKKPFYHFCPGSYAYSIGTVGCNLRCLNCQNWDISQTNDLSFSMEMSPEKVIEETKKNNLDIIAFTYNEPTIWYEYMMDIAKLAHKNKIKTVMVSNGYINQKPLLKLLPYLDAINVDLKSFNKETYGKLCQAKLESVLETIKTIYKSGKHLEIIYLVVPGFTDKLDEIEAMAKWIIKNTSAEVPLHLLRFFPSYKLMNTPEASIDFIEKARAICLKTGLKFVYGGNY